MGDKTCSPGALFPAALAKAGLGIVQVPLLRHIFSSSKDFDEELISNSMNKSGVTISAGPFVLLSRPQSF